MSASRETWRPITQWSRYQVSDQGRVRSARKVLTQRADGHGYFTVTLSDGPRRRTARVHVLVAEAFLPPRLPGQPQVRHLNGRQWDNRASNLAWGSQSENERDKTRSPRTSVRGRNLGRTETRPRTEDEPSRDAKALPQLAPAARSPGEMPVSSQVATELQQGLATAGGAR
jgi:hypothetical protein